MAGRAMAALVLGVCVALMTASVALADPTNTSPPQLSGTAAAPGALLPVDPTPTLSLSTGTWSSTDTATLAYQWQSCSYPNAVLGDAPVAYYRLGEPAGSTRATDSSGFGQPDAAGTTSLQAGAPGAIAGDGDTAYAFPQPSAQRSILYTQPWGGLAFAPTDFAAGTSPATIEAWIDPAGTPATEGYVAGFGSDTGGDASLNLEISNTAAGVRLAAFDGARRYVATSGSIVAGRWYHVALTYDGTSIRLYQDGSLVGTFAEQSTFALVPLAARIDASVPMTSIMQRFGGTVDDLAFYDTALDASTLAMHHAAGTTATSPSRCDDIPGATASTFAVPAALAGSEIRGQVVASDSTGATAAWSTEVQLAGAVAVPQTQDLTTVVPFGPTLVSGTVVDAAGGAVAGARVSVYANLPTWTRVAAPLLGEALTGSDGSFRITYADASSPLLNLIVVARGLGVGTTTYLARQYDDTLGDWTDDSGALPAQLQLALPADATPGILSGPSRMFPAPCPPPRKTLFSGPRAGIVDVGDVHTWSYENAQFLHLWGSKTTVNIAASFSPSSRFATTNASATFTSGYTVTQHYPVRGPNTSIAETTAANAAEFKTTQNCWETIYTVEPTSFIGGTTNPRTVSAGLSGHCPTYLSTNSTYATPGSQMDRSTGRGYTFAGGFTVSFPFFSIGLNVRTDWSRNTTETWWPLSGAGRKLWFCGDGSTRDWANAQRIYQGPWTS